MFTSAVIVRYPSGRYGFVGYVPASLCDKSFETLEDAKAAAFDVMATSSVPFRVGVEDALKEKAK